MANPFKDAALSFYSGSFYGELARNRQGIGMSLMLVLTLILSIIYFALLFFSSTYVQLHETMLRLPEQADQLPALTVKNGHLSIDKPVPYKFNIGTPSQEAWIIIDTDYNLSDVNQLERYMKKNNAVMLLTATKIVARDLHDNPQGLQADDKLEISDFRDSQQFTITHDSWRTFAVMVQRWGLSVLLAIFFFATFAGFFLINFCVTVFTALAIMVLDMFARLQLKFAAAMRLAAAARIPINLLAAAPLLVGRPELAGGSGTVLWVLYILFAVMAVRLHPNSKAP